MPAHRTRQPPRAGLVGRQRCHRIDGFQMPLPGANGPGIPGDLHGLDGVGELDARAECGAFDGADDLPAVGFGAAAISGWNLLPRRLGKLFEQRVLVSFHGEDVVRSAPRQIAGAGLCMWRVGCDHHI